MMKIKVHNPNNLPLIDYRDLAKLQGNLKTLDKENYLKLKLSFEKKGFFIPFFLWIDKANADKPWLLDGHQRLTVLEGEKAQPYKVPYLRIDAANLVDAKEKLMVITSQYGTMTEEGLQEYIKGLPAEFIAAAAAFDALPNIFEDPEFKKVSFMVQTNGREGDKTQFNQSAESYLNNTIRQIVLYFDVEKHKRTLERLAKVSAAFGLPEVDNSETVLKLLDLFDDTQKLAAGKKSQGKKPAASSSKKS